MEGKDYRACRWAAGVAWGLTALYVLYCLLLVASIVWEAAGPEGREPLSVLGLRPYTPYAQEGRFSSVPYFAGSLAESLLLCGAFWQGAALFGGMRDGKTPFARGGWRRVRAAALCVGLTAWRPRWRTWRWEASTAAVRRGTPSGRTRWRRPCCSGRWRRFSHTGKRCSNRTTKRCKGDCAWQSFCGWTG